MHKYAIIILSVALISSIAYAMNIETNPETLIENKNREAIIECLENVYSQTVSKDMKKQIKKCESIPMLSITGTASGAIVPPPPKGYTAKHSLVLSGSHDYRIYSDRIGASWKNNNSAGLTWGVSSTLKSLWKERGIKFEKGTLRPKREGGNYILFSSIEDGLRAKVIAIRERWGEATVREFLRGWGTDYLELSFDTSKYIKDLSEEEFAELFIQQMKKESPGLTSQLVKDGILIIN